MFFDRFPTVGGYVETTQKEVRNAGSVRTFFGRYRRFNFAASAKNSWKLRMAAEREAVNFKIQSTSSDLVLSQLIEVDEHIHEIGGRLLLTVHDSIAGEILRSRVPEMKAFFDHWIVRRIEEQFGWMPVPFKYDLEIGPNYGELAPFEALELYHRNAATLTPGEIKTLKKSIPILRAAGLIEDEREVAYAG
jgi:DNA polymerase I-like protein with 3'-5' exonuclease and polymerase domains